MHVTNVHVLDQGDRCWPGSFEICDVELEIVSGDSGKKTCLLTQPVHTAGISVGVASSEAEKSPRLFSRYLLLYFFLEENFIML